MRTICISLVVITWVHEPAAAQQAEWRTAGNTLVGSLIEADLGQGREVFGVTIGLEQLVLWDGRRWQAISSRTGVRGPLGVFDDGSGPAIYAIVSVLGPSGIANEIQKWDGQAWLSVGAGLQRANGEPGPVSAMTLHDFGQGPRLVVVGDFARSGTQMLSRGIAYWDGSVWNSIGGSGVSGYIDELLSTDFQGQSLLFVAGAVAAIDGIPCSSVAAWDGTAWSCVGGAFAEWNTSVPSYPPITGLAKYDDGTGERLYISGFFDYVVPAVGLNTTGLVAWDGLSMQSVGSGVDAECSSLAVFDPGDGSGPGLYIAGSFSMAGNMSAQRIVRYDGSWSNLDQGIFGGSPRMLATYESGHSSLFVSGVSWASGMSARGAIRWSIIPNIEVSVAQSSGGDLFITANNLEGGREYRSVYGVALMPSNPTVGAGGSAALGLDSGPFALLLDQYFVPPNSPPFRFTATAPSMTFGPYILPPGLSMEAVMFDNTGFELGLNSKVIRFITQ